MENEGTEVVLCELLKPSLLSRQTWNNSSVLPLTFALFGKQFVQKVRMNKSNGCLNANKSIYETMLSLNEILLVVHIASHPLQLRTFQLLKLIISIHKLGEFAFQVTKRLGYKFILSWSNTTGSTG